jgi:transposase
MLLLWVAPHRLEYSWKEKVCFPTCEAIYWERRQPVAFLPDHTAATLAQWLREHSGVEVIARDRSKAYADGARQSAPAAIQVADRFHLLQNLAEAMNQVFTTHGQALDAVSDALPCQPVAQMFGRARLDLLSRRFVRTPACGQEPAQSGRVAA